MLQNYVFIDFENVQPKNLELLLNHPFKVYIFVGANQVKVPIDLATAMQDLGVNGKYIKISGNGPNALDFHIAYYIGELASKEPAAFFHIISKDTGFDPLRKHLLGRKIKVLRHKDLAEIPVLQVPDTSSKDEKMSVIVKNLIGRGSSKPRKVSTLKNTINTLFTKKLKNTELDSLVSQLVEKKYIVVKEGTNVTYKLPKSP